MLLTGGALSTHGSGISPTVILPRLVRDKGTTKSDLISQSASCAVRNAIQAADQRHGELRTHDTSHLLVEETLHRSGGTTTVQFYHPVKLMQYVLDHAPKLARHYFEVATRLGDQCVWKLMLGFDEQTPGAKVNADNKRKNMVCVMNFVEVGHDCLELDDSWFVPLVLRAGFSRAVRGVGILYRLTYVK